MYAILYTEINGCKITASNQIPVVSKWPMYLINDYCIYCFIDLSLLHVVENINIIKEQRKKA